MPPPAARSSIRTRLSGPRSSQSSCQPQVNSTLCGGATVTTRPETFEALAVGVDDHRLPRAGRAEVELGVADRHPLGAPPAHHPVAPRHELVDELLRRLEGPADRQVGHRRLTSAISASSSRRRLASQNSRWLIAQAPTRSTAAGRTASIRRWRSTRRSSSPASARTFRCRDTAGGDSSVPRWMSAGAELALVQQPLDDGEARRIAERGEEVGQCRHRPLLIRVPLIDKSGNDARGAAPAIPPTPRALHARERAMYAGGAAGRTGAHGQRGGRRRAVGRRGQGQDRRLALRARRRDRAVPGRAQRRAHAGDRRHGLQAVAAAVGHRAAGQAQRDRQRRGARPLGADRRDREAAGQGVAICRRTSRSPRTRR